MPDIKINLLGSFQVMRDARPVVEFASEEVRAMLAYLVTEQRPRTCQAVTDMLWPNLPEEEADKLRHQAWGNLHRVLGDYEAEQHVIHVEDGTLRFNPESACSVDVLDFRQAIADVAAHRHSDGDLCTACYLRLLEAEQLYRGEFLADLRIDSGAFEAWTTVLRETLHLEALDVLQHLADYAARQGNTEISRRYSRRQVDLEPWWEVAHRELVRDLTHGTQRGWAIAIPEQSPFCAECAWETATEPVTQTPSPTVPVPHNLTKQLSPLIGREDLLQKLITEVENPDCRVLTLLGAGGSGKTRLAQEVAQHLVETPQQIAFSDGVFFVELVSIPNGDSIVPTIAQAIGYSFSGQLDPQEELFNYLRNKHSLLVLDNFEHLIGGSELVIELLQSAPNIRILTTSRVKLDVAIEQVLMIPGMAYPTSQVSPEQAGDYSAIQLFTHFAQRVQSDFQIDGDNVDAVIRICDAVYGMPLGILLASSWVSMLKPDEIADEVEHSLDFLSTERRELPARQRSMRAVFEHTWSLLPEREQQMLASLAVFEGGWTREAALEVAQVTLRDLLALINKCLVQRTPNGRYGMHELLRQYSLEHLEQQADAKMQVRDAHGAYYVKQLSDWLQVFKGPQYASVRKNLTSDFDNVSIAYAWQISRRQFDNMFKALDCLCRYYEVMRQYRAGESFCKVHAEKLRMDRSQPGQLLKAMSLAWASRFAEYPGNVEEAQALSEASLAVFGLSYQAAITLQDEMLPQTALELSVLAFALYTTAMAFWQLDYRATQHLFDLSYQLYVKLKDKWHEALALIAIGGSLSFSDEGTNTFTMYEAALAIYEELADPYACISLHQTLGHDLIFLGYVEEGEMHFHQAHILAQAAGVKIDIVKQRALLFAHILKGEFDIALDKLTQEKARLEDLGLKMRLLEINAYLYHVYLHAGDYETATRMAQESLKRCEDAGYTLYRSNSYILLSRAALGWGKYELAQQNYLNAYRINRETNKFAEHAIVYTYILYKLGDHPQSHSVVLSILRVATSTKDKFALELLLPATALTLITAGRIERAIEIYALACIRPHVAKSQWFEDIAGQHICEAAANLRADVVAAAQARGRELDIWETAEALVAELEALEEKQKTQPE